MSTATEFFSNIIQTYGVKIIWIVALFIFGKVFLHKIIHRITRVSILKGEKSEELGERIETLCQVLSTTGKLALYTIILLMVLGIFGIDIKPLLAGAGIIGLAIGLGSRALVQDVVSGIFILAENQYGLGDRVKIGSSEGKVIKITVRSTVIEDDDGNSHYISNGSIKNVINIPEKTTRKKTKKDKK